MRPKTFHIFALPLLSISALGRLVGFTRVDSSYLGEHPEPFTLKNVGSTSHQPNATNTTNTTKPCPASCACVLGDPTNGGKGLLNGICMHFCSEMCKTGYRHCGEGADYTAGDSIDCSSCKLPSNYGATSRVYAQESGFESLTHAITGKPTRSLIVLNPWNGSSGYMWNWTVNHSGVVDTTVTKQYRIIDVAADFVPGKKYASWFNYKNDDDWWNDEPIPAEVDRAVAYVHHLIESEYKVVGDYRRIVLAGLSQGAALALESALRFPHALGLVISQRGVIGTESKSRDPLAKSPYVMMMGQDDHYYGVDSARTSCRFVKMYGGQAFLKAIPGLGHNELGGPDRVREQELTLDILKAVANADPADSAKAVAKVTEWTPCGYD